MQRTSQQNTWLLAAVLAAVAGIIWIAAIGNAVPSMIFFLIAALFFILAFTQGDDGAG